MTIRVLTSIIKIRKGAVRTVVSFLFRCHDLQEKMIAGVWSLRAVISFLLLYVVRNPRLTIRVLTSIIKNKERRCPRKRLVPHRHMVKKNDRHGWKRWAVISFCRYCHYRMRSSLDNPRDGVYNKDKERRCPCKRLVPHRHMVKKNDRQGL